MIFNPFSLENKTIVITGASSGIGRQCAIDCSKMGAKVVLVARNSERLQETIQLMEGDNHCPYTFDLINTSEINNLIYDIVNDNGRIDGFVHAAGIEKTLPLKLLDFESYENLFKVNSLSAFEFIHHFSNKKFFNNRGHIVLISSIAAVIGRSCLASYAASKGALISAVRSMAIELASKNICINCISPGTILTPLMQDFLSTLSEEDHKKRIDGFPLGLGTPQDIANACIYLLSDASRWVTGQNFVIDGGYTIQ